MSNKKKRAKRLYVQIFAAISVGSSVQVTLQFYFQIFYSTAPKKLLSNC